jgi:chromosome segregation ATPase
MSEIKKLSEEELQQVKEIKQEYTKLALSLGELELQKANLEKEKTRLLNYQDQLGNKEVEIAQKLTEKYGNGSINIETGEITM